MIYDIYNLGMLILVTCKNLHEELYELGVTHDFDNTINKCLLLFFKQLGHYFIIFILDRESIAQ